MNIYINIYICINIYMTIYIYFFFIRTTPILTRDLCYKSLHIFRTQLQICHAVYVSSYPHTY